MLQQNKTHIFVIPHKNILIKTLPQTTLIWSKNNKKVLIYIDFCFYKLYNTKVNRYGRLAQLVEQLTLNQWVQGSSPWSSTKK